MRAKAVIRGSTPEERLRRWQFVTAATLLVGYTGYYLCRSNLSVAAPLMLEASGPTGFSRQTLGMIASAGALAYALGKFVTGVAGDFAGGRTMFLLGMIGAAAATAWFGLSSGVTFFVIAWAFNRLVQSAGWGGLVKVTSHWFPARSYGSVMGALSLSYLFGDAVCRLVLARFIAYGADWRQIFLGSAAALAGLALIVRFTLKASPEAVGLLLGTIVENQGWPAVFLTLAGVCFASVVVVWIYTREHATVAAPQRLSV